LVNSKFSVTVSDACLSVKICGEGDASHSCHTSSPIPAVSYPRTFSQKILEDCSCFQARVLSCGYKAAGVIGTDCKSFDIFLPFEIPVTKAGIYQNSRTRNSELALCPWVMKWLIKRGKQET
jgi:hypothetical protein